MAKVIQHLETVSTGYKVFEDNQVLTKDQLNALVDYLDDQERLTRVALIGVGVMCGLRVSVSGSTVTLSKGAGVTTDGDLLRVPNDLKYTRFRPYDQTAPRYDLFYKDNGPNMRTVFELLGDDVSTAAKLDTFATASGKKLGDMVAVLLMESFQKDGDLCTGGDCDNKGKDALSNVKLLLLDLTDVAQLKEKLETLSMAARQLEPTYADRVPLSTQLKSVDDLTKVYRKAATDTRARLKPVLSKIFPACRSILGDIFAKDPAPGWQTQLETAVADNAIQPYYDHLKHVVAACNAIGEVIAGDTAVCCPPLDAFPKHLVLGVAGADSLAVDANRTGFYPSPLVRARVETVERVRFLVRRLDTLIGSFKPIVNLAAPVITPSQTEDRPIDERAIPMYYAVNTAAPWPIHRAWSYQLERRGLPQFNYSANSKDYGATEAVLNPLIAPLAPFSFIRVEGHLGMGVDKAVAELQKSITGFNLPFAVRAVLLGADRPKIVIKPPIRYNDLHRIHHLIRHDITVQLDEVKVHSERFKTDVDDAVKDKIFENRALPTGESISGLATATRDVVKKSATDAMTKLSKSYSQVKADPWHDDLNKTLTQSTGMRMQIGEVTRTEMATPVDSLLANKHVLWAEWLDRIIETKDEEEDDKLLFTNFIAQHPAAEHCGGVARGGTFVLIYDGGGKVVGDVALPYYWPETADPEPEQKPLPPPKSRPPVIDKGWRLLTPLDKIVETHVKVGLDDFKKVQIDPIRTQALDFQKNYVQAVRESVDIVSGASTKGTAIGTLPLTPSVKDAAIERQLADTRTKAERTERVRKQLVEPSLDATKRAELERELAQADKELSASIEETSKIVSTASLDKTDGATAIAVMADGMSKLNPASAATVGTAVKKHADAAGVSADTKAAMGGLLRGRGLPG